MLVALRVELVERDRRRTKPAPCSPASASRSRMRCAAIALWLAQARVGLLREPADRAAHAAGALVGRVAQHAGRRARCHCSSSAAESSGRPPGSSITSAISASVERRLDAQADPPGRLLDRPPQLVAPHRPDEHLVGAHEPREPVVRRAAAVEVGAHREHHLDGRSRSSASVDERVEELRPLVPRHGRP